MTERLRNAILAMWEHRYDVDPSVIPPEAGDFPGPIVVDLGQLAIAHGEVVAFTGTDEALPDEGNVVNFEELQIREEADYTTNAMCYVEAAWGPQTHRWDAVVRDLEAMRRGTEDPSRPLRPPVTYHEATHIVMHVRALANDMARHFGIDELVRSDDDLVRTKPA